MNLFDALREIRTVDFGDRALRRERGIALPIEKELLTKMLAGVVVEMKRANTQACDHVVIATESDVLGVVYRAPFAAMLARSGRTQVASELASAELSPTEFVAGFILSGQEDYLALRVLESHEQIEYAQALEMIASHEPRTLH